VRATLPGVYEPLGDAEPAIWDGQMYAGAHVGHEAAWKYTRPREAMAGGMATGVRRWWVRFGPSRLLTGIVVGLVGVLAVEAPLDSPGGLEGRRSLTPIEIDAHRSCEAFVRQRFPAFSAAKFPSAAHPDVRVDRLMIDWVPFMEMPVLKPGTKTTAATEIDRRRLAEYWDDRSGEYYSVESFVDTTNGPAAVVRSRVECEVRWPGAGQRWRLRDLRIGADAIAVSRRMR
jgi:hypothetical protein